MTGGTSSNYRLMEGFLACVSGGDFPGAAACFHPEAVIHEAAVVPYGDDYRGGPAGFLALLGAIDSSYTMAAGKVDLLDAGDQVVVLADVVMTSKLTGGSLQTSLVEVFSFADGLISADDVFYKDAGAVAAVHA